MRSFAPKNWGVGLLGPLVLLGLLAPRPVAAGTLGLPYTPDANTVGLWHMDEAGGDTWLDAATAVGGANNGTSSTSGALSRVAGMSGFGTAANGFATGTPAEIDVSSNAAFNVRTLTVEAWIMWDNTADLPGQLGQDNQTIASRRSDDWNFGFAGTDSGTFRFAYRDTGGTWWQVPYTPTLAVDTWYHAAASMEYTDADGDSLVDDTILKLYFDEGGLGDITPDPVATQTVLNSTPRIDSAILRIGRDVTGTPNNRPFKGYIDEFRFSDMARTQFDTLAVPEPSSVVLLVSGLVFGVLGWVRRRRSR